MTIIKVALLSLYSSLKKKLRRIRSIFDIEKWLWKLELCSFQLSILKRLKCQKYFYWPFCSYFALLSWLQKNKFGHTISGVFSIYISIDSEDWFWRLLMKINFKEFWRLVLKIVLKLNQRMMMCSLLPSRDGTRNSSSLVPRGPRPFFTPRFPEE